MGKVRRSTARRRGVERMEVAQANRQRTHRMRLRKVRKLSPKIALQRSRRASRERVREILRLPNMRIIRGKKILKTQAQLTKTTISPRRRTRYTLLSQMPYVPLLQRFLFFIFCFLPPTETTIFISSKSRYYLCVSLAIQEN